jgi:hypothetical protein
VILSVFAPWWESCVVHPCQGKCFKVDKVRCVHSVAFAILVETSPWKTLG